MIQLKKLSKHEWIAPTLLLVVVVLLASWISAAGDGGYSVDGWAPVALILATLALAASAAGAFKGTKSPWSNAALGLFAAYTVWTFASLLWAPNQGDAWLGAGQTLLYLLAFWLTLGLISLGASRTWVLAASVIGPALVADFTLPTLVGRIDELFLNLRLIGTVKYYNGEAAFLLVPFWVAVYLAGSRRAHPILRGAALAGAVVSVELAVLTQSRGAMLAMIVSLPVFFLISGQRLRGFFALVPITVALLITFPGLNDVYLGFLRDGVSHALAGGSGSAAIEQVLPAVGLTTAGASLYGFLWGLIDQRWRPPSSLTRVVGGTILVGSIAVLVFGVVTMSERVGNPISWGEQRWEAFQSNAEETDTNKGQENNESSRYLSEADTGRYAMWQVAWKDFTSNPLLGVGTHNYEATYYQLREQDAGNVRQPHSLPLEVLAERGIVGGILFFAFLATCLGAGLWRRFKHLGSEDKAQVGALIAAITYWFVHSSIDWFWQLPAVTLPAVVYLAMLVGPWQRVEAAPLRWPLRAAGAGAALLAVAVVAPLYAADHYLKQKEATTNPQEALTAVEHAQRFNPLDPWLRVHEAESAAKTGDLPRAERALDEAIRLHPEHYSPYILRGKFYEQVGEPERARQSYRQAVALDPLGEEAKREVNRLEAEVEADR